MKNLKQKRKKKGQGAISLVITSASTVYRSRGVLLQKPRRDLGHPPFVDGEIERRAHVADDHALMVTLRRRRCLCR